MRKTTFKQYIPFFFPIIPILCIGVALMVFGFSIDVYQPVAGEVTNPVENGSEPSVSRTQFLIAFKDISLVVASGIITLTSAYIGGLLQSIGKKEEEIREKRRRLTQPYEDYIHWLLQIGQRASLLEKDPNLKAILPNRGEIFELSKQTFQEVIEKMPLAYDLFPFGDSQLKNAVNDALDSSLGLISDIYSGKEPNFPEAQTNYVIALEALENYEKNMA